MGKVLAAFKKLGKNKPILWGMGLVNRRLGILAATNYLNQKHQCIDT